MQMRMLGANHRTEHGDVNGGERTEGAEEFATQWEQQQNQPTRPHQRSQV